jgi:hypothetical protein
MDNDFVSLLTQTCSIKRRTPGAKDSFNVPIETFTNIVSSEACLIQTMDETIEIDIRGKKEISNVIGFFKSTANIDEDDVVTFGNKQYIVLSVDDAGGQSHHLEVMLRALQN